MTALDVAKRVALKVGLAQPEQLYASTTREHVELAALLNETATDLADAYDWNLLRGIHTVTGDGAATAFDLPTDYGRMLRTASIWSSRYQWAMEHILDTDRWLEFLTLPYTQANGIWTIYGGQLQILDTMADGDIARFFYISNQIISPASGDPTVAFVADTDTFRLSEKLLLLLAVVKWKAQKQQNYDEDLANFEIALRVEIDKDGGSKPIISGRGPVNWRQRNIAWPGHISGIVP